MNEIFRQKLLTTLENMNSSYGVQLRDIKKIAVHKSSMKRLFEVFDMLDIKYSLSKAHKRLDSYVKLKSDYRDSLIKIEDYDDSQIAKKYDFSFLLSELKTKLLDKTEICTILNCRRKDYRNIITYMSLHYPIYEEEEDETIGYLTI